MKQSFAEFLICALALLRGYSKEETIVLLQQARLETGHYTAKHWWTDRNLFGMSEMRNVRRRRRLAGVRLGADGLYRAQFKTLPGSILDRMDWDAQNGIKMGPTYLDEVAAVYHPSSGYAAAVRNIDRTSVTRAYWLSIAALPLSLIILSRWFKIF